MGGFAKLQSYRVIFGITVKNPEMRPMKIADGLRDSPFGGVVKEVCVKIGMIAHLLIDGPGDVERRRDSENCVINGSAG
jgi:hypothetical protein